MVMINVLKNINNNMTQSRQKVAFILPLNEKKNSRRASVDFLGQLQNRSYKQNFINVWILVSCNIDMPSINTDPLKS